MAVLLLLVWLFVFRIRLQLWCCSDGEDTRADLPGALAEFCIQGQAAISHVPYVPLKPICTILFGWYSCCRSFSHSDLIKWTSVKCRRFPAKLSTTSRVCVTLVSNGTWRGCRTCFSRCASFEWEDSPFVSSKRKNRLHFCMSVSHSVRQWLSKLLYKVLL